MFPRQNLSWLSYPALVLLLVLSTTASAQTPEQTPPPAKPPDDVVKVFTELVQTDVMVFDKQGRFVDGLTKDNFEIKIDGQSRPIQFFEQIKAGAKDEDAQLAAARGNPIPTGPNNARVIPLDRGRTILFYVDDLHLDPAGFSASRKIISDFIEKDLGQNDQVAIASATGQIGFLQQLTNDRKVLRLALDRLGTRTYTVTDMDRPAMSEYEAMLIDNNNLDVFEFFVNETIRINGRQFSREMASSVVRSRAQQLLSQAAMLNTNMLSGLERLVRNAKDLPGRKLVFFISNGFLVHNRRGDAQSRLQRITSAAAKNGVVIYSFDSRGLATSNRDLTGDRPMDLDGTLARSSQGESQAFQDGLNSLARDTGGRPVFNTNDFRPGLGGALKETAVYYLLAWQPDLTKQKAGRFRNLQVNMIGRSDLSVRVRKGFFELEPSAPVAEEKKKPTEPVNENKVVESKLKAAIAAPYPKTGLPISLAINYYDTAQKGPTLATSVQIPGEFMLFGPRDGKTQAVVDVTGVYFDDKGQAKADFYERLITTANSPEEAKNYRGDITYTYPANVPPGLYQVRVAVRDDKSGLIGTAHQWVEVPDLTKSRLSMSSLLLGERTQAMMRNVSSSGDPGTVLLNAAHRFRGDSTMRFLVFAYNAALSQADPKADVAVQVLVIRDDQPVITTALKKINIEGITDLARIPYAAEVPLSGLQTGRYILQVTLIDRTSKESTTRQTHFDIY